MEQDKLQELIAGLAFDILDEPDAVEARQLLETDPAARALYDELRQTVDALAFSIEPQPLPAGSLSRLRQKAGITEKPATSPAIVQNSHKEETPATRPVAVAPAPRQENPRREQPQPRRSWLDWFRPSGFGYAAAAFFLALSILFGTLWANTSGSLNDSDRTRRELEAVLSSPNLKVTDLKPTGASVQGNMRIYADPASDRAYLVVQNLAGLSGNQVYEAWFINDQNQARRAGAIGRGGSGSTVYRLDTGGNLDDKKLVAVTVEPNTNVQQPTTQPFVAGEL
jgi:hypothetical protein